MGDADIVKEAFIEAGADILFWKARMKPGTPIVAAKCENKILFGLSGNPAAAYITFEIFSARIIEAMGKTNTTVKVEATLESNFVKISDQSRYLGDYL